MKIEEHSTTSSPLIVMNTGPKNETYSSQKMRPPLSVITQKSHFLLGLKVEPPERGCLYELNAGLHDTAATAVPDHGQLCQVEEDSWLEGPRDARVAEAKPDECPRDHR